MKIYDVVYWCVLSPIDMLCLPQRLSIETEDTGSYKTHTNTDEKPLPGFHLQNHTDIKYIIWEKLWEFSRPHRWHCAAHGWVDCSHGTYMTAMSVERCFTTCQTFPSYNQPSLTTGRSLPRSSCEFYMQPKVSSTVVDTVKRNNHSSWGTIH